MMTIRDCLQYRLSLLADYDIKDASITGNV